MKSKNIIISILDENALKAKNLISEDLAVKLGQRLAEEYIRVAKTTFNEGMDPVGKEDEDVDNDGDEDSTDEYLLNRREAIGDAMSQRGSMRTGPSAETPKDYGTFPKGFLKAGQEPLAAILNVMRNPEKHPPAHREFAQRALATIQGQLRKNS